MTSALEDRLVDAALRLLEEEGPLAFSQARVAKEAGLQQGHLTYYFPRKADLVTAVLARFAQNADDDVRALAERVAGRESAAAERLVLRHLRAFVRTPRGARALLSLLALGLEEPDVLQALGAWGFTQRVLLAGFLGRAPDDVDVELALATLSGLSLQGLLHRDDPRRMDALVTRLGAWLRALPPRRGAP